MNQLQIYVLNVDSKVRGLLTEYLRNAIDYLQGNIEIRYHEIMTE